jgi:prepilin-type N-terminal cleavage/methylation domain-containing protein
LHRQVLPFGVTVTYFVKRSSQPEPQPMPEPDLRTGFARQTLRGRPYPGGFTLAELLVVMLLVGIVAAGMGGVFSSQNRAYVQQDLHVAMEENLRAAMTTVVDSLRYAGCGVPSSSLDSWIGWVGGFTEAPVVVTDGGLGPDMLSVATCTPPLAKLTAPANAGDTSIAVASTVAEKTDSDLLNTTDKGLIWIGDGDHARIRSMSGGTLVIDTDPTQSGNQGLLRSYPPGTPVSRVDVHTFTVHNDVVANVPALYLDKHHGMSIVAADGISDLKVSTLAPGSQYRVKVTARSERKDPISGAYTTRSLVTDVRLRN